MEPRLVLVSHTGEAPSVARQIAREVRECGARPFLDEAEINVGADFEEDILGFLEKADELVVLLTPWAPERPYVWAELGAASGRRAPIVGLLHLTYAQPRVEPLGRLILCIGQVARSNDGRTRVAARNPDLTQEAGSAVSE